LQIEQAKHDQFNKKYDEMPLQTGISSKQ